MKIKAIFVAYTFSYKKTTQLFYNKSNTSKADDVLFPLIDPS
jgi:hypothetical protein